jgi:hypothetical protein
MNEELIYSRGEVSQLLKATITHLRDMNFNTDRDAVEDLMDALKSAAREYRTVSEIYLGVLINKHKKRAFLENIKNISYKKDYEKIMKDIFRVLFQEEIGKMPLLMNNPVIGYIAMFRLRIGR